MIICKKKIFKYFIRYNSFNIYNIWNASKNKIIKTQDIIFNENLGYNFTNIDLNEFINEPSIDIYLFELIQLNFTKIIEIDSNKT